MICLHRIAVLAVAICLTIACFPSKSAAAEGMVYTNFKETTDQVSNPCRGWYTDDAEDTEKIRANNITLLLVESDLGAFKNSDLSRAKLDEIRAQLTRVREANCSAIFRAAYDFDGDDNPEPGDFNQVLRHIGQLKQVFHENADILYIVQAGFFGPWGEWHHSSYGEDADGVPTLEKQKALVGALMNAVPIGTYIDVRRPSFVRGIMDGQTLTEANAFSGSPLSRLGVHNDAVLSGPDDDGTYGEPGWNRDRELTWQNNHNRYTPFVGESDMLADQSKTKDAIRELNLLHASSLNMDYFGAVIDRWKNESYGGMSTFRYIGANLGYRFVLHRAGITPKAYRGGAISVHLELENKGFGGLLREKKFEIIAKNGTKVIRTSIGDDPRRWYREKGRMSKDCNIKIPSDAPYGTWTLYASLSDPNERLKGNPAYSVRFSNEGIWDAASGMNRLGTFTVVPGAEISNFGATQKTVYVKRGKSVKLPFITYAVGAKGAAGRQDISWKASSPKIATVSKGKAAGKLAVSVGTDAKLSIKAGKKLGTSKITLTAESGKKIDITVKVVKRLKKVAAKSVQIKNLSKKEAAKLRVGQTKKLKAVFTKKATAIATWKSSNNNVVRIDAAGKLTALSKGSAKITLKVGGKKRTIAITVL